MDLNWLASQTVRACRIADSGRCVTGKALLRLSCFSAPSKTDSSVPAFDPKHLEAAAGHTTRASMDPSSIATPQAAHVGPVLILMSIGSIGLDLAVAKSVTLRNNPHPQPLSRRTRRCS